MPADDLTAALQAVPAAWKAVLPGWTDEALAGIERCIRQVSAGRQVVPADPYRALRLTSPDRVRVVVLGQDPYPTAGHADGLAFSSPQAIPHSLRRVFEVLSADRPGWRRPATGRLDAWARQGVLLLNPVLTVEVGVAGSHVRCGWQALTSQIIQFLCRSSSPPAFLLWGKAAQASFDAACPAATAPRVLRTRHPSHDVRREFMADGSHFVVTSDAVDWWSLGGDN